MKRKTLAAIAAFLVLFMAGCTPSLEQGWKAEDAGKENIAIKYFSRALIDSEKGYRRSAAEELVKIGEPAVPALIKVLLRKSRYYDIYYSGSRKEAAWAMGEIGSREAVPSLLRSLQAAQESYREKDLIFEFAALNSRAGLAKIVKSVARHSNKDKESIIRAVKENVEKVEEIVKTTFDDKDNAYSERELISLMDRIKLLQMSGEEGRKVREEALNIVKSRLKEKRSSAPPELTAGIEALGKIGDRRAEEPLLEMLKETYTRPKAALALARIGDKKSLSYLKEALEKEKNSRIKLSLEAALYLMGDKSKWKPLVEGLKDRRLRVEAVELLGKIGDRKGVGPLIETLSDDSPEVRKKAVKALKLIGGKEAEAALLTALNDEDYEVRKEAVLSVISSEESRKALRKMLNNKKEKLRVRLAAAYRLAEWGDRSGLALALELVKNSSASGPEKLMAIRALGKMGEEEEILRGIYQNKEENYLLRFEARKALRTMGEK